MRKGRQKLLLYPDVEGDGSQPTKTPGKLRKANEVDRLEKVKDKAKKNEKNERNERNERNRKTNVIVADETIRTRAAPTNGLAR